MAFYINYSYRILGNMNDYFFKNSKSKKIKFYIFLSLLNFYLTTNLLFAKPPPIPQGAETEALIYPEIRLQRQLYSSHLFALDLAEESTAKKVTALAKIGDIRVPDYHLDRESKKFRDLFNDYSISTNGAAFSTRENGIVYDYYQISLEGMFTPNEALSQRKRIIHVPILATTYTLDAYPMHFDFGQMVWRPLEDPIGLSRLSDSSNLGSQRVALELREALGLVNTDREYNPKVSKGSSTVTRTRDLGISGGMGWPGNANVTGNLSISRSISREIPDVEIQPHVGINSHAKWTFKMNNLRSKLEENNVNTVASFSPEVKWIWKIPHEQAITSGLYFQSGEESVLVNEEDVTRYEMRPRYYFTCR